MADSDLTFDQAKTLVDEHGSIRKAAANSGYSRDKIMRVLNKKPKTEEPAAESTEPGIGHNSDGAEETQEKPKTKTGGDTMGITGDQLKSYIERIEKLEEEKANIGADIREVYSEAKANGFDTKVMRQLVRLRKMDQQDRAEQEELLHVYKTAIGME
jgi:uncharacterized protein (UPF0335 family)